MEVFSATLRVRSDAHAASYSDMISLTVDEMINQGSLAGGREFGHAYGRINPPALYGSSGCPDLDFNARRRAHAPQGGPAPVALMQACSPAVWTCHATGNYLRVSEDEPPPAPLLPPSSPPPLAECAGSDHPTMVSYNGYNYRTLHGAPKDGTQSSTSDGQVWGAMPEGFSVSPNSATHSGDIAKYVIAPYRWDVWRLCTKQCALDYTTVERPIERTMGRFGRRTVQATTVHVEPARLVSPNDSCAVRLSFTADGGGSL